MEQKDLGEFDYYFAWGLFEFYFDLGVTENKEGAVYVGSDGVETIPEYIAVPKNIKVFWRDCEVELTIDHYLIVADYVDKM